MSRWKRPLKILCAVALLALVVSRVDLSQVGAFLRGVRLDWTLGFGAAIVLRRLIRAVKWRALLSCHDIRLPLTNVVSMTFIAHSLGTWTPGGIGGDVYRVAALRGRKQTAAVVSTLMVERYVALLMFSTSAAAALPWTLSLLPRHAGLLATIVIGLLALLLALPLAYFALRIAPVTSTVGRLCVGRIRQHAQQLDVSLQQYREHWPAVAAVLLLGGAEVVTALAGNALAIEAVGVTVAPSIVLGLIPLVHLLVRLPISWHGIGLQELSFAAVLQLAGHGPEVGLAVSLLHRVVEWICSIGPGFLLLSRRMALSLRQSGDS